MLATTSRSGRSGPSRQAPRRPPTRSRVTVAEAAGHPPPLPRRGRVAPAELAGRLGRGVSRVRRRPGALAGLEGQDEPHTGSAQRSGEARVVAVGAVGHDRPEPDAGLLGGLHQFHGELWLGLEPGIALATRQPGRRSVGHGLHRPVAALVGPRAGHRDDAVVDLADRAEILAGHMGGGAAVLAVAGVVDHQRPSVVRGSGRVLTQQPHPPLVEQLMIPGRLGQEPLQPPSSLAVQDAGQVELGPAGHRHRANLGHPGGATGRAAGCDGTGDVALLRRDNPLTQGISRRTRRRPPDGRRVGVTGLSPGSPGRDGPRPTGPGWLRRWRMPTSGSGTMLA